MAQDRQALARRCDKIRNRLLDRAVRTAVAGPIDPALVIALGAASINAAVLDNPAHALKEEQLELVSVFVSITEGQLDSGQAPWN